MWFSCLKIYFLVFVLLGGCSRTSSEPKDSKKKEPIDVVASKLEKQQIFDPREFGGRLQSGEKSPLFAMRSGVVKKVFRSVGAKVGKGQAILSVAAVEGVGLKPTVVRAPISGVISQLGLQRGSLVEKGERFGVVSKEGALESIVYVTGRDLQSFEVDSKVDVEVSAASQGGKSDKKLIQARVVSKALQPDARSTGYAVRIALDCQNGACDGVGLGAFLKMILKENFREGFRLPLNVLHSNQTQVLLVDREQKARWQAIELGSTFGDQVEISKGLEEPFQKGWLVVTGRSKRPKEGDQLKVTTKEELLQKTLDVPLSTSTKKPNSGKG